MKPSRTKLLTALALALPPAATTVAAGNPVAAIENPVAAIENPVAAIENPETTTGISGTTLVFPGTTTGVSTDSLPTAPADSGRHTAGETYRKRVDRYRRRWQRLIPSQHTVQYAGSIGIVAFGTGWHYGRRDNWETELLLGFVPKYNSDKAKVTLTLRQRYVPWHLPVGRDWHVEPLTAGLFFSSIFGGDAGFSGASGFGGFGQGFGGRAANRPRKGDDLSITIDVSAEDAFHGTTQKVTYRIVSTGERQTISVKVPAGAVDGGQLRFKGMGEYGQNGGTRGDLLVTTHVLEHPIFKRKGAERRLFLFYTMRSAKSALDAAFILQ